MPRSLLRLKIISRRNTRLCKFPSLQCVSRWKHVANSTNSTVQPRSEKGSIYCRLGSALLVLLLLYSDPRC